MDPDLPSDLPSVGDLLAAGFAATLFAVQTVFEELAGPGLPAAAGLARVEADAFDWPALVELVDRLALLADEREAAAAPGILAANDAHRLLFLAKRIAYREGAGRNAGCSPARVALRRQV
ncbi:hypothetical protein [Kitasatospora sp. NPDC050543]|uniref:hypothetical protein n=1 Tax=Kitasatospora sp. NPDC050543 TaxID=3364054 RepID=UPI0037B02252